MRGGLAAALSRVAGPQGDVTSRLEWMGLDSTELSNSEGEDDHRSFGCLTRSIIRPGEQGWTIRTSELDWT
jgi:hypothetical protein